MVSQIMYYVFLYCDIPEDAREVTVVFSSPEQHSGRAIVLPLPSASALASASTNVKVFVEVFKTSLFPNLITDLIPLV